MTELESILSRLLDDVVDRKTDLAALASSKDPDERMLARELQSYALSRHGIDFSSEIPKDAGPFTPGLSKGDIRQKVQQQNQEVGEGIRSMIPSSGPLGNALTAWEAGKDLLRGRRNTPEEEKEYSRDLGALMYGVPRGTELGKGAMGFGNRLSLDMEDANDLVNIRDSELEAASGRNPVAGAIAKNIGTVAELILLNRLVGGLSPSLAGPQSLMAATKGEAAQKLGQLATSGGLGSFLRNQTEKLYTTGTTNLGLDDAYAAGFGALTSPIVGGGIMSAPWFFRKAEPVALKVARSLEDVPVLSSVLQKLRELAVSPLPKESALRGGVGGSALYEDARFPKDFPRKDVAAAISKDPELAAALDEAIQGQDRALGLKTSEQLANRPPKTVDTDIALDESILSAKEKVTDLQIQVREAAKANRPTNELKDALDAAKDDLKQLQASKSQVALQKKASGPDINQYEASAAQQRAGLWPEDILDQEGMSPQVLHDAKSIVQKRFPYPADYDSKGIPVNPQARARELLRQASPQMGLADDVISGERTLAPLVDNIPTKPVSAEFKVNKLGPGTHDKVITLRQAREALEAGDKSLYNQLSPADQKLARSFSLDDYRQLEKYMTEYGTKSTNLDKSMTRALSFVDADRPASDLLKALTQQTAGLQRGASMSFARTLQDIGSNSGAAREALMEQLSKLAAGETTSLGNLSQKAQARDRLYEAVQQGLLPAALLAPNSSLGDPLTAR